MNQELAILRAAIAGITQLIAGRGLKVTQMGTQAFVEKDPVTNKPKRVNIPHLPDNASPALIRAVQGFIDHECGHILDTDYDVWREIEAWSAREGKGAAFAMWNIVEDTYIERAMAKRFPGTEHNLQQLHQFFVDEITSPALKKAGSDHKTIFNILLVPMARAWAGQDTFVRYMADKWHLVADEVTKIGALKDRFPLCQSSADTALLAKALYKALYEKPAAPPPPKKEKPPAPPKPPKPPKDDPETGENGEAGAPNADDDAKEGEGESKAPEAKPEPEAKPKKPKKEPKREDEDEPEVAADEPEAGPGDDEPDSDDSAAGADGDDAGEDAADDGADADPEADAEDGEVASDAGGDSIADGDSSSRYDKKGKTEDDKLKKLHRRIMRARYDKNKSFAEIAKRLRKTEADVVQLHDEALTRISANLGA